MIRGFKWLLPVVTGIAVISGCSSSGNSGSLQKLGSEQPVTVTLGLNATGYLNEEEFARYITDPVKNKYPWITVQRMAYEKGKLLPDLVAIGETPDIVFTNNINSIQNLADLDLSFSLTELIKQNNMDLNRFENEALDAVKAGTQRTDLIGIPYTRHFSALYYNKSVFDKFGAAYPKDGITWDDAYEIARKLTRLEDGIQYRGLEPNVTERPASQLSLPYIDPKTETTLVNSDSWKKVLEFMTKVYEIPGNSEITVHSKADEQFAKQQRLAMLASNNIIFDGNLYRTPDLNWDMVSYPTWKEAPGIGLRIDEHIMSITQTSKHKDAAFKVISVVTSDEVQMDLSRQGRVSVMKDQKIRESYGANMPFMQGKNINAIYGTTPAKPFVPTKHDSIALSAVNTALKDIVTKGKDVNTALREAEETINKKIKEKQMFGN